MHAPPVTVTVSAPYIYRDGVGFTVTAGGGNATAVTAADGVRVRMKPLLPNAVLGMFVFVLTEVMLFAGLVSAFAIARSRALFGWPPPGQPRLPFEETAVNTAALLLSGVALWLAGRAFTGASAALATATPVTAATPAPSVSPSASPSPAPKKTARWLAAAFVLGAFFVGFQGVEWYQLIGHGLLLQTSQHSAFFYLIVGTHALHALAAIAALGMVSLRLARGTLSAETFQAVRVFWYFVVLVWPTLYLMVYR